MTDRITSFTHEGLTFDVRDEGPLDGTPVVLLHGFPERASSWDRVVPFLHEQGLRTLAPDQRGYSPGARPPRRRDYRMGHLVADVAALVDRIGKPVHLVGHDWGSAVAWLVAAGLPGSVRSLTAVSVPHPMAFMRAMLTSRQGLLSWYMYAFQLPVLPEAMAKPDGPLDRFLRRGGMTEEEVARFRREIVDYGALPGALGWYRAQFLVDRGLPAARVRVPTTLVWSDGDVAIGRRAVDLTPPYVKAAYSLEVLEGVTHWIPTQAPVRLARIVLDRIASVDQEPA
jgi:pimeloyl-ACP methyl ester carboxylesterase